MTADHVTIRRLSATAHVDADRAADHAARIDRLHRNVADRRLDDAFASLGFHAGIWCLRRLDVPVRLDPAAPDGSLEQAWAAGLSTAVQAAFRGDSGQSIHYRSRRDALADLVAGIATRRTDHAWAWRTLGLLGDTDPDVAQAPRDAVLTVLRGSPHDALGGMVAAASRVGVAALHRMLGGDGWAAIATVVARSAGSTWTPEPVVPHAVEVVRRGEVGPGPAGPMQRLADRLVEASTFAALLSASRIRPTQPALAAWAVMAAAEADPSILRRSQHAIVIGWTADTLGARMGHGRISQSTTARQPRARHPDAEASGHGLQGPPAVGNGPQHAHRTASPSQRGQNETAEPSPDRKPASRSSQRAAPPLSNRFESRHLAARKSPYASSTEPDATGTTAEGASSPESSTADNQPLYPTECAGLLFLLATAPAAGIPDDVITDPTFAARPLPWVLQGIACELGIPSHDPVIWAFAGLDPTRTLSRFGDEPATPPEDHGIKAVVQRWTTVTAAAMGRRGDTPADVAAEIIWRRGTLAFAPGWVELEMSLDDVDLDIRRAGLDLDPGWVPWLGTVVRYAYG